MIPKFEASVTGLQGQRKLVLKDVSTYEGATPTNRYWIITNAEGSTEEYTVVGTPVVNETFEYDLTKDVALIVKMAYNYNPIDDTSLYSKQCNVICSSDLCELVYDLRKYFLDNFIQAEDYGKKENALLEDIELIDAFYETALRLLSTDILGSQKALDFGNEKGNEFKHCNNIPAGIPPLEELT